MRPAALFLLAVAACNEPYFQALTAPPPGKQAALNAQDNHIALSRGVALAFECTDSQDGSPCAGTIVSDDAEIAAAFPASLDSVSEYGSAGPQPRSAFVVVAESTGTTTLHFRGTPDHADFSVDVEP